MQVYLVRHTRVALPPGICYGVSDVALAGSCEHEMNIVIQKLMHLSNPFVYSSPLSRCRLLAEKLSNKVILDDRLKELNFGVWELQPWDSIKGPEAGKWMNNFVNISCPGGESYLDLSERVRNFLFDLSNTNTNAIVIVTHAGIIRSILSMVQNIPLHQSFEIQIAYGEIVEICI
jgi:alpha-ribazole phosphatase